LAVGVTSTNPAPFAAISAMSQVLAQRQNVIRLASGENSGARSSTPLWFWVSLANPEPLELITAMSPLPTPADE
jgi:hypothetical protein